VNLELHPLQGNLVSHLKQVFKIKNIITMKSIYKRKNIFPVLALLLLVSSMGCKKTLDINQDPNNPSLDVGTPKLVFPAATMAVAGAEGGDLAILGAIYGEYVTQSAAANQYKYIDAYDIKSVDLNRPYSLLFSGGLKNLQFVIDKSKANEDWNFYLMGTVMKAYATELLVDLYGSIPYSEALQGNGNLNPKFDDGYSIYKDLLSELDTALSKDFSARTVTDLKSTGEGNIDVVFQGDINKWKEFANTLELKLYLRMVNAKPDEALAGINSLYARNAQFLTSDAGITTGFTDAPGQDNPLYEQNIRQLNVASNLRASYTFVSFLKENNDPRLVDYFGSMNPKAINQGDFLNSDPNVLTAAVFVQSATDPVIFISKAESYFLQAEAALRYNTGADAKSLYDEGVTAAFASENEDGSSFIAPGGAYEYPSTGTFDDKLQSIIVQKWASFAYGVHFIEGWFERNRTGYPKSSPVYSSNPSYVPGEFVVSKNSVLPVGQYPKRLVFPDDERSRNTNAPAEIPATTPVWWGL
jgi:hypothetical protein